MMEVKLSRRQIGYLKRRCKGKNERVAYLEQQVEKIKPDEFGWWVDRLKYALVVARYEAFAAYDALSASWDPTEEYRPKY